MEECGTAMTRWRSGDGGCNNLQQPHWGQSHTAYVRLVAPLYSDSQLGFRLSSAGLELPSARAVSDRLAGRGLRGTGRVEHSHWSRSLETLCSHWSIIQIPTQ